MLNYLKNLVYLMPLAVALLLSLLSLPYARADDVNVRELQTGWKLRGPNGIEVPNIKIPSGVFSALKDLYGDVLASTNDVDLRWIANETWTYVHVFSVPPGDLAGMVNLTFNGIDTVSTIRLNGKEIGRTNNMFVRYSYNILPYLDGIGGDNTLEIEILSPLREAKKLADQLEAKNLPAPPNCPHVRINGSCHRNMLRKMQSSFGDDWSPSVPSMGIWQSVRLESYDVAMMQYVDVAIRKNSTHWILDNVIHMSSGIEQNYYAHLIFRIGELLDDPLNITRLIKASSPSLEFEVAVPLEKVTLWWPNGYGTQKLYPLIYNLECWLPADGRKARLKNESQRVLKVGFRSIQVVEDKDGVGRTFYFKVNNYPIFIKGVNYMPVHILPEMLGDTERIKHLLYSAAEANVNMVRVFAGGVYESDYFYELADQFGILVWQDMPFTRSTYPITDDFVESVSRETAQNILRLAYHPSLALIATNDEIEWYLIKNKTDFGIHSARLEDEYKQLFMGTIRYELNIISQKKFAPLISTPSMGIEESKKDLLPNPQNNNYGDVHFWEDDRDGWDPDIYPPARFVSEYGFQSLPSWSSWNHSLGPSDTIVNLMRHRQHDPKGFIPVWRLIARHFPTEWFDNWEGNIEAFIYFSQIAQAMAAKTATEVFRSRKGNYSTMGAIYFQWNDVWVAPTWSAIDFFGNYKVLYYWAKEFLAPTTIIALYDAKQRNINVSFVRDDYAENENPKMYDVYINVYKWSEMYMKKKISWVVVLQTNSVFHKILDVDDVIQSPFTMQNCFLEFVLSESEKVVYSSFFFFPGSVSDAVGMQDPELKLEMSGYHCNDVDFADTRNISYSIRVTVRRPALFVYLEVVHPEIKQYKFSENGFVQVFPVKTLNLQFGHKKDCLTITEKNLRFQTINQYAVDSRMTSSPNENR